MMVTCKSARCVLYHTSCRALHFLPLCCQVVHSLPIARSSQPLVGPQLLRSTDTPTPIGSVCIKHSGEPPGVFRTAVWRRSPGRVRASPTSPPGPRRRPKQPTTRPCLLPSHGQYRLLLIRVRPCRPLLHPHHPRLELPLPCLLLSRQPPRPPPRAPSHRLPFKQQLVRRFQATTKRLVAAGWGNTHMPRTTREASQGVD